MGVFLGSGTGVACGGGSLGVVEWGPPVESSSRFAVLVPWPDPGCFVMILNISSFQKSSLKYAKSVFSLSMMSINEDLHNSTVVGMYPG